MKSVTLLILSVMAIPVIFAEVNPIVQKKTFVIKREEFGKPLIWIRPSLDKNNQVPTDVFCDFIDNINSKNYAKAMSLCIPFEGYGADRDPKVVSILNDLLFPKFVDGVLLSAGKNGKDITISEFAIKGKGGSWRVEYKFDGRLRMVDFQKAEGVWKICEQPAWYHNVAKTRLAEGDDFAFP